MARKAPRRLFKTTSSDLALLQVPRTDKAERSVNYELKRVRLPGGQFITRKLPYSDPAEVARAKPEEVWKTGDEREILVKDMETTHIVNAMKRMMETALREMSALNIYPVMVDQNSRVAGAAKYCCEKRPVFKTMQDELKRRLNPQPKSENQIIRKFDFD